MAVPDTAARMAQLEAELQDACLVIGRQQVALLRLEQVLRQVQQQLDQKQEREVATEG